MEEEQVNDLNRIAEIIVQQLGLPKIVAKDKALKCAYELHKAGLLKHAPGSSVELVEGYARMEIGLDADGQTVQHFDGLDSINPWIFAAMAQEAGMEIVNRRWPEKPSNE